jgi:hypothetical protein
MNTKQQLQEERRTKEQLSEMCFKLVHENIRLQKKIKALSKHKTNKKKECNCDCHMFIGGSGKACPDCIKSKCSEIN